MLTHRVGGCIMLGRENAEEVSHMALKYETAYFCGYSRLPNNITTSEVYVMLTLGLKIELETGRIQDVSVTLLSPLAQSIVKEYFINRNVIDDYTTIVDEVSIRHQGNAAKSIIKAYSDIRRNYIAFMNREGPYLRGESLTHPQQD